MPFKSLITSSRLQSLLTGFLCAGSSSLLISLAHLYPQFWFVSLFALVPFLWRAIQASLKESVLLGCLLATSCYLVGFPSGTEVAAGVILLQLLGLNAIFAVYAAGVNRIGRHIGINAIFVAALWLPLEYAISHWAGLESLFTLSASELDWPILTRIGSLFGMLMVSFVIVLVNSLVLLFLRQVVQALSTKAGHPARVEKPIYAPFKEILLEGHWHYYSDPRAPPLASNVPT